MDSGGAAIRKHFLKMARDRQTSVAEHLFIVSTVGQIRNAVATIKELKLRNAKAILLSTPVNPELEQKLKDYADLCELQADSVLLPRYPSLQLPWRDGKIKRIYDALYADHSQAALWLANSNIHYGYLAYVFSSNGRPVNAFEEGMSTYLREDDPRFRKSKITLSGTLQQSLCAIGIRHSNFYRRLRRVARLTFLYVNNGPIGFFLRQVSTRGHAKYFENNWTQFDRVVVSYPALIDAGRFQTTSVEALPVNTLSPNEETSPLSVEVIRAIKNFQDSDTDTVFVSQTYGVDPDLWGDNLASILVGLGLTRLCLKFHPRETERNRTTLEAHFNDHGIEVYSDPELDRVPLETIFTHTQVRRVIGLTSTALLNLAVAFPECTVESIAHLLLHRLRNRALVNDDRCALLQRDSNLLKNIAGQVRASILFNNIPTIIGGSGPSLRAADHARIPANVRVMRVNNFFLERQYYLGRDVDHVYFSADKRALRFYIATLLRSIRTEEYSIKSSISHNPNARPFSRKLPFEKAFITDSDLKALISDYAQRYGVKPTTGICAIIYAWETGADEIYLSGIDLYQGASKYVQSIPPRLHKIIAPNLKNSGYDTRLHSRELDLSIIEILQSKGVNIMRVDPQNVANSALPLAPKQNTPLIISEHEKDVRTQDWVAWAGVYPLSILLALRKLKAFIRP